MTTINVTAEHIASGKKSDCGECPIALAIKEVVKDEVEVGVGTAAVTFQHLDSGEYHTEYLPLVATGFITGFDHGCPVVPFNFELPIRGHFLKA